MTESFSYIPQTVLRDDAIKTLQQARDEYHDKLIEQEEILESLTQDVENLRADIQERTDQVRVLSTWTVLDISSLCTGYSREFLWDIAFQSLSKLYSLPEHSISEPSSEF